MTIVKRLSDDIALTRGDDGYTIVYSAIAAHTHPSTNITDFAEAVDDRVAALLVAGSNVTLTYNDGANTLTIASSGGAGSTDEQAQDAVGGILVDTATIDLTYNDATPSITADVKDGSITAAKVAADVATQAELDAHLTDATDAHAASAITNTPAGTIAATTVQAAINELDTEKAATGHTHTAANVTDFNEAAQDAVGTILTDSTTIDFTYNDAGNTITAAVIDGSITAAKVAADVATQAELATFAVKRIDGGKEGVNTLTSGSGATTLSLTSGNVHDVTLISGVTYTFTGAAASNACSFTLIQRQDGTGSRSVTWPASVDWPKGTGPTITTASNSVDVFTFVTVDNGTTWLGFPAGLDVK